ncbi:MAG: S-adenosylmethionine:tRNA ribosyltransferase-isomerase [Actinomycetota bacterium]|nr:S-adenosylmethionine:tRNA ribosyltransferase-isomerase [Actinomycetota bacterium]
MTVDTLNPPFILPPDREASGPPEARGLARDEVRLLVSDRGALTHSRFRELPGFLHAGDLLVVNDSATLSAAVDARIDAKAVVLHFSTWLDNGLWVVEVRSTDGRVADWSTLECGLTVRLPDGVTARLIEPWLPTGSRLWTARIEGADSVIRWLHSRGRPITYAYVRERWSAEHYETVFGRRLGSAEMPSAGRPFTDRMVTNLVTSGIAVAPITLHTGVSSPEVGEPPSPERFAVSATTARLVAATRAAGGRVVAVGTTVTRALETVAARDGRIRPGSGWTELVLSAERPTRVVDGLVTGWHAPGASHLGLLESVVGARAVRDAYDSALATGYLWHEFGDSALLLR